ncbi:MAG: M4 family metallopeptidase [Lewinellaceae bacterium]|nr:M4 family metallopeptidase [Lewinellaceae bacterium]
MKKNLIVFCLAVLATSSGFAQTIKPAPGKKAPNQINLQQKVNTSQQSGIMRQYLQMEATDDLKSLRTDNDEIGFSHERFQQYYKGVKVDGATYTVHSKDGVFDLMTGDYRMVSDLDVNPAISVSSAFDAALNHVGARQYAWEDGVKDGYPDYKKPEAELVVVADPEGIAAPRLAYKFDIFAADPLYRANVFIDAHTGAFIQEHSLICNTNVPATGNSLYNGSVPFTADFTGTSYRLRQTTSGSGIQTFNLNNGTNYTAATDFTSATSNFTGDNTGVSAHWGAERTHAYYLNNHGRNSYNGTGAIIKSYVHYSNNYVNAFWDGSRMTYGDGDGSTYSPLVSLDICGHEITHGVTQYSANLVYSNQSGALNESFSDIFGEAIENYASGSNDWLMGHDIFISGSGAIRSMSNPNLYADPDTYLGTYWYTGSGDNGGVHTNSGVQNKWFYILSQGESGTNDLGNAYSVTGIGIDNAAAIAYRNLTVYLTSSSNYAAARAGAIQAAKDLFGAGSPEEIATTDAWYAVGVGTEYGGGGGGGGPVLSGYFETGWDGWTDGGADCARVNSAANSYEGNYSIQIRDNSGTASAMTSAVVDVSAYDQLALQFYFRAVGMENNEDFWVRYFNGTTWSTIASYARGANFNNNTFYVVNITMSNAQYTFPTNAQFRFQCDASDDSDNIYIDAVTVNGTSNVNIMGESTGTGVSTQSIKPVTDQNSDAGFLGSTLSGKVMLFPNPVADNLYIQSAEALRSVKIYAANGVLVKNVRLSDAGEALDVSSLAAGLYFVSVETESGVISSKFVKK